MRWEHARNNGPYLRCNHTQQFDDYNDYDDDYDDDHHYDDDDHHEMMVTIMMMVMMANLTPVSATVHPSVTILPTGEQSADDDNCKNYDDNCDNNDDDNENGVNYIKSD